MGQVPFISPLTEIQPSPPTNNKNKYLIPLVLILVFLFLVAMGLMAYKSTQPRKQEGMPEKKVQVNEKTVNFNE